MRRVCVFALLFLPLGSGILFPQSSETRDVRSLDGLWTFVREPTNSIGWGLRNGWWSKDLSGFPNSTRLPVPASFNDMTEERALRDHVGWVWYQRSFRTPLGWPGDRNAILLRFASVHYEAVVFVDGRHVTNHTGGHLPFEADVTGALSAKTLHVVTVAVNNTLSHTTIPQGEFTYKTNEAKYPPGFFEAKPDFDFKNYAGIHRSVSLLLLPKAHILDAVVTTELLGGGSGKLSYLVNTSATLGQGGLQLKLTLYDGDKVVATSGGPTDAGAMTVGKVVPWWPLGMGQKPVAKLYQLQIQLETDGGHVQDVYRLDIGFRTVKVDGKVIRINGKPFYCTGFGMHEDSDIRGRGFDWAVMIKDLNALEWMGGNCFRTSHYPYAEERFAECDRRGIAVVAETPAVGLRVWTERNRKLHGQMLTELVQRDKNHACVFAWSLANEPQSQHEASRPYFKALVDLAHELDPTRPATIVISASVTQDKVADLTDFHCMNRYYGWYIDSGHPEVVQRSLYWDLSAWFAKLHKPIILTEYGAGSLPDVNAEPGVMFSEAYQVELLSETHKVLDRLRRNASFGLAGEMIWNFADFMTAPGVTRHVRTHVQVELLSETHKVLDRLRRNASFGLAGEMIWNFADFMTAPGVTRHVRTHVQVELLSETHKVLDRLRRNASFGLAGEMIWNFADFMIAPGVTRHVRTHVQVELLSETHKVLDRLRRNASFGLAGEMIWNFADFMTAPGVTRHVRTHVQVELLSDTHKVLDRLRRNASFGLAGEMIWNFADFMTAPGVTRHVRTHVQVELLSETHKVLDRLRRNASFGLAGEMIWNFADFMTAPGVTRHVRTHVQVELLSETHKVLDRLRRNASFGLAGEMIWNFADFMTAPGVTRHVRTHVQVELLSETHKVLDRLRRDASFGLAGEMIWNFADFMTAPGVTRHVRTHVQVELLSETHKVLDRLRRNASFGLAGEMIWNFADFMTAPGVTRHVRTHVQLELLSETHKVLDRLRRNASFGLAGEMIWNFADFMTAPGVTRHVRTHVQVELLSETHKVLDRLRRNASFGLAGEMIWNFADFMTAPGVTRHVRTHVQVELLSETHKVLDRLRRNASFGLAGEMIWNFADFMTAPGVTRHVRTHVQVELLSDTHKGLDRLRRNASFGLAGEMIWNFADFMTAPGVTRVAGNRKGVMKRNRQPKLAAYVIKRRYSAIAEERQRYRDHKASFAFLP